MEDLAAATPHTGSTLSPDHTPPRRKRGRPLEMTPQEVLRRIRELADRGKLIRVHLDVPALYARARRLFGTWAAALGAAGVNHAAAVAAARELSIESRRRRRRRVAR